MILVTGASGFIGQHLVRFLSKKGEPVRALYRSNEPDQSLKSLPDVTWQQRDLLDVFAVEEAMQGVSDIYHCAAIVTFNPRRREEMVAANVETTANLVNAALEGNIRKLVHVSSVAAIGRPSRNAQIDEAVEWEESRYNSAYGLSKYLAEIEVWRGIGEGLNAVIINPGIVLGVGNWHDGSAQLMTMANKEFPFYTNGVTAWVDVADVVGVMYRLMHSDIEAERFILSAGNYAFKDVFDMMAKALNKKQPGIKAGNVITTLLATINEMSALLFKSNPTVTRETAKNAQAKSFFNNGKLLKYLPDLHYTSIQTTIENMAQHFLKTHRA
jgi:dihydroflavonol-4-reductase